MSVRFTSGNIGRLTFEHANRMADATDAVESMPVGDRISTPTVQPDFIVGRLTQKLSLTVPPNDYEVWNWVEIGVTGTAAARSLAPIPRGLTSTIIGESPLGRAINLGGKVQPNDLVTLFPMKDETGESWYAFVGKVMGPVATLLGITASTELFPGRYRYQVQPLYINAAGQTSPNPSLPAGFAFNAYELSDRHGQELEFDDPPSKLIVAGPVDGPVVGVLSSDPASSEIVYVFEAPSPLTPECLGPVPGTFGALLGGNIS